MGIFLSRKSIDVDSQIPIARASHARQVPQPATRNPQTERQFLGALPYNLLIAAGLPVPFSNYTVHPSKMSFWDALTGRKSSSQQQQQSSPTSDPASESSTSTSSHAFTPAPFDPSSAQGVDSFLNTSAFADPSQLHPLAGLNKESLEYLTLEDSALSDLPGSQSAIPSRGFSDDLCYGTGITYLTALSMGGAWGLQEGLRRSTGQPPKLRLNSTLNAITRRGPFLGNSAGVVAITYNCFNSAIGYFRGKHDAANTILAGVLSGMIFKSTRGVRQMMISGGVVGSIAGVWAVCFPPPPFPHLHLHCDTGN